MIAADTAIRAWVNGKTGLTGAGNPLANGAFTRAQRSPASGCYVVLGRTGGSSDTVAEQDTNMSLVPMGFTVYGGTAETAEIAAAALASAIENLTGNPEPCGQAGVRVLVSDHLPARSPCRTRPTRARSTRSACRPS